MARVIVTESQKERWLCSWPELATRPELFAELECNSRFRNFLFRRLGDLDMLISDIKDRKVASRFLMILYKSFCEDLRKREADLDKDVFNQSIGVLRNHLLNVRRKLGDHNAGRGVKNPHYVFT